MTEKSPQQNQPEDTTTVTISFDINSLNVAVAAANASVKASVDAAIKKAAAEMRKQLKPLPPQHPMGGMAYRQPDGTIKYGDTWYPPTRSSDDDPTAE